MSSSWFDYLYAWHLVCSIRHVHVLTMPPATLMSDCFQVLTVSCWCKLWFRNFYYICSLMKALHLTNKPCNCLRLFSKHSCSGTVLWFFFHCCLWYLTHVDTVMRHAGMNGLNFCMVEGENCRLYGPVIKWNKFFIIFDIAVFCLLKYCLVSSFVNHHCFLQDGCSIFQFTVCVFGSLIRFLMLILTFYTLIHMDWKYLNFCSKFVSYLWRILKASWFQEVDDFNVSWFFAYWKLQIVLFVSDFDVAGKCRAGLRQPCSWHLCKYAIYYA